MSEDDAPVQVHKPSIAPCVPYAVDPDGFPTIPFPPVGQRGKSLVFKSLIITVVPIIAFFGLAAFSLKTSQKYVAPTEDLSRMSPDFTISIPSLQNNGKDVPVSQLVYYETHTSRGIDINVGVTYDNKLVAGAISEEPPSIIVTLPQPGAKVDECESTNHLKSPCEVHSRDMENYLVIPFASRTPFESGYGAHLVLSGIDGVAFRTTASRMQVHFPSYFADASTFGFDPNERLDPTLPHDVFVSYAVDNADKYSWTDPAPIVNTYIEEAVNGHASQWTRVAIARWDYRNTHVPLPLTGVRDDVLDKQAHDTFKAGIWLGIGGSALIAALQAFFAFRLSKRSE